MSVARVTEITAMSPKGFQDAVQEGIERANKTLRNVKHAWVKEHEIYMENGQVTNYEVTMKVTFILED
ncbi:MAG: dodecin domain-containing protein [Nitriliruptorales bacterium]|nr:dodecin domain-containing protein [Nitriliruptorales bacterium]